MRLRANVWLPSLYRVLNITKSYEAILEASKPTRVHLPLISLPAKSQFYRVLSRLLTAAMAPSTPQAAITPAGLKKIPAYWFPYTTMAKGRWLDREFLEVVSTEFRDRSVEYYVSHKIARLQCVQLSPEIRLRIRGHHSQWQGRETRHNHPERRSDRVSHLACARSVLLTRTQERSTQTRTSGDFHTGRVDPT
jgi:hypothetical protein